MTRDLLFDVYLVCTLHNGRKVHYAMVENWFLFLSTEIYQFEPYCNNANGRLTTLPYVSYIFKEFFKPGITDFDKDLKCRSGST